MKIASFQHKPRNYVYALRALTCDESSGCVFFADKECELAAQLSEMRQLWLN
jgi:hypothetical protein